MPKDKFETLCHVKADVSTALCTSSFATGNVGYRLEYDIVLLVGLTELKAQVSWIDSATVRASRSAHAFASLKSMRMNPGNREEVCSNVFRVPFPRAEPSF